MSLSEKMYGLLSGSTTLTSLTGTRIYPITLPQDPKFPAVRYAIISSVRDHAMTQDTGGVHARVQLTSWGRTPDEAENVSEGVRATVQRLPGREVVSSQLDINTSLRVDANKTAQAQTFQVARSVSVNQARFWVRRVGSPQGSLSCELWRSTSGTLGTDAIPTTLLATSTGKQRTAYLAENLSTSFVQKEFDLPPVSISTGNVYAIALRTSIPSGTPDVSNYVKLGANAFDAMHSGNPAQDPPWVSGSSDFDIAHVLTSSPFECFLENEFVDFDSDAGVYAHNLDVTVHYQE